MSTFGIIVGDGQGQVQNFQISQAGLKRLLAESIVNAVNASQRIEGEQGLSFEDLEMLTDQTASRIKFRNQKTGP